MCSQDVAGAVDVQRVAHVEGAVRERVLALAHQCSARCRLFDRSRSPNRVRLQASLDPVALGADAVVALDVPDSGRAVVAPDAVGPDLGLLRAGAVRPDVALAAAAAL